MADELETLLAETEEKKPEPPASEPKAPSADELKAQEEQKKLDEEIEKKRLQKENLEKAIFEMNATLKKGRKESKKVQPSAPIESDEDELPQIDLADPSAKAWDKHIRESVSPLQEEVERQKEEVRSDALKVFLSDKPELASNPDKIKKLVGTYERLKSTSERSVDGVVMDIESAYAALNHRELIEQARYKRISEARANEQFSDPAISRGATAYSSERVTKKPLAPELQRLVDKWDTTLEGLGYKMNE